MGSQNQKVVLQGWHQVQEELGILGELLAEKKRLESEMEARIARITGDNAEILNSVQTNIETKTMLIEQFTRHNMDDIRDDGVMTKKFTTGVIKTKKQEDLEYPGNEELLELLRQYGLTHLIDRKEKPLKSAIKAVIKSDASLVEKLGIDVTETIKVTIKPY